MECLTKLIYIKRIYKKEISSTSNYQKNSWHVLNVYLRGEHANQACVKPGYK